MHVLTNTTCPAPSPRLPPAVLRYPALASAMGDCNAVVVATGARDPTDVSPRPTPGAGPRAAASNTHASRTAPAHPSP
jgi:hypothetical protein